MRRLTDNNLCSREGKGREETGIRSISGEREHSRTNVAVKPDGLPYKPWSSLRICFSVRCALGFYGLLLGLSDSNL